MASTARKEDHTHNGTQGPNSSSSNHLFIKSVSPLATVQSVKDFFKQAPLDAPPLAGTEATPSLTVADDIELIEFVLYPQSKQKYCQVTFKSSAGVTSAMTLNGHLLHGVPTPLSVIDPGLSSSSRVTTGASQMGALNAGRAGFSISPAAVQALLVEAMTSTGGLDASPQIGTLKQLVSSAGILTTTQATQLITHAAASKNAADQAAAMRSLISTLMRAAQGQNLTSEMLDLLNSLSTSSSMGESEEQQIKRTLFVSNIPEDWTEDLLAEVLTEELALGTIIDRRLDVLPASAKRFALVEFTSEDAVIVACQLDTERRTVTLPNEQDPDSKPQIVTLEFEPARATVRPREPENVSFTLGSANVAPVPIAYQSINKLNLEEKLLRVRALADKLASQKSSDVARGGGGDDSVTAAAASAPSKSDYYDDKRRRQEPYDPIRKRRRRYYKEDASGYNRRYDRDWDRYDYRRDQRYHRGRDWERDDDVGGGERDAGGQHHHRWRDDGGGGIGDEMDGGDDDHYHYHNNAHQPSYDNAEVTSARSRDSRSSQRKEESGSRRSVSEKYKGRRDSTERSRDGGDDDNSSRRDDGIEREKADIIKRGDYEIEGRDRYRDGGRSSSNRGGDRGEHREEHHRRRDDRDSIPSDRGGESHIMRSHHRRGYRGDWEHHHPHHHQQSGADRGADYEADDDQYYPPRSRRHHDHHYHHHRQHRQHRDDIGWERDTDRERSRRGAWE